jgi:hypothetical protein
MGFASSLCFSLASMVKRQDLLPSFACFAKMAETMNFSPAAVQTCLAAKRRVPVPLTVPVFLP